MRPAGDHPPAARLDGTDMRILITGGAGYIGSHTLVAVLAAGHEAHVIDNLSNGSEAALARVRQITNRAPGFTRADIRDPAAVAAVVAEAAPEAVIHFAGLKAVGESVSRPLAYFDNNVAGTLTLLAALQASPCRRFVFSSSATVYGDPDYLPIDEAHPRRTTNPYGRSKHQIEGILEDLAASDPAWSIALLRYFNPVGAHASARIGEDPAGIPNNLVPYIAQVAVGRRPRLQVFGGDYATPDGTGVRDYVHVSDLAQAHLAALDWTAGGGGAGGAAARRSTSGPAAARRCWRWCGPSSGRAGGRSPTPSHRAAPATSPPVTPPPRRRRGSSAGAPRSTSTRCAAAPGSGSSRTRTGTRGRGRRAERTGPAARATGQEARARLDNAPDASGPAP
jgi:UDP-glucose 4-epimerase